MNNIWDDLNIKRASDSEQNETGIADFAASLGQFRKSLMQNGFNKEEALYLTGQWLMSIVQGYKK